MRDPIQAGQRVVFNHSAVHIPGEILDGRILSILTLPKPQHGDVTCRTVPEKGTEESNGSDIPGPG